MSAREPNESIVTLELRAPRLPIFVRALWGAGLGILAALLLLHALMEGLVQTPRLCGIEVLAGIATLGAALATALALRAPRREPERLVVLRDGLDLPRWRGAAGRLRVPFERIAAVHFGSLWARPQLVLGIRGRLPRFLPLRAFAAADAATQLVALLRARIGALADGADRLHELDLRAGAAQEFRRGRPTLAIASAAVVVTVFGRVPPECAGGVAGPLGGCGSWTSGFDRLVSASLMHGDARHLFLCVVLLLFLGGTLERLLGSARFALILLGSALVGNLAATSGPGLGSVSGTIGLLGGLVAVGWRFRSELPGSLMLPAWCWALLIVPCPAVALWLAPGIAVAQSSALLAGIGLAALSTRAAALRELRSSTPRTVLGLAWLLGLLHLAAWVRLLASPGPLLG